MNTILFDLKEFGLSDIFINQMKHLAMNFSSDLNSAINQY